MVLAIGSDEQSIAHADEAVHVLKREIKKLDDYNAALEEQIEEAQVLLKTRQGEYKKRIAEMEEIRQMYGKLSKVWSEAEAEEQAD